jgi:hypothetical protein
MHEREISCSVDSIKKCPVCEGPLERGYVIAFKGFWWDTEKHTFRGGKMLLSNYPAFTNSNFPARRCGNCHIIIFDYEMKT